MYHISSKKEFKEYLKLISEEISLRIGDQITFKEVSEIDSLKYLDDHFFGLTPSMKEIVKKRQAYVVSDVTRSNADLPAFRISREADLDRWIYSPTWIETLNGVSIEDMLDGFCPHSENEISCNIDFTSLFQ